MKITLTDSNPLLMHCIFDNIISAYNTFIFKTCSIICRYLYYMTLVQTDFLLVYFLSFDFEITMQYTCTAPLSFIKDSTYEMPLFQGLTMNF